MNWTLVHDTDWTAVPDTVSVAAGQVLADGWPDLHGHIYTVASGALVSTPENTGDEWSRDMLLRPVGEAAQDTRVVVTTSLAASLNSSSDWWGTLRWVSAGTCYLIEWGASSNNGGGTYSSIIKIYKIVSASATSIVTSAAFTFDPTHQYQADYRAVGVLPTSVSMVVTDLTTGNITVACGGNDSQAELQTIGRMGVSASSNPTPSATTPFARIQTYTSPVLNLGFIGDSITAGTGATVSAPANCALTLAKILGQSVSVTNRGLTGTTTTDWLPSGTLLGPAITALSAARVTVVEIMLGANDAKIANGVIAAIVRANLLSISNTLVSAGFTVIINYPLYLVPGSIGNLWNGASDTLIQSYGTQIDSIVNGTTILQGDRLGYPYFAEHQAELNDGVHPNDAGTLSLGTLWANATWRLLDPVANYSVLTTIAADVLAIRNRTDGMVNR